MSDNMKRSEPRVQGLFRSASPSKIGARIGAKIWSRVWPKNRHELQAARAEKKSTKKPTRKYEQYLIRALIVVSAVAALFATAYAVSGGEAKRSGASLSFYKKTYKKNASTPELAYIALHNMFAATVSPTGTGGAGLAAADTGNPGSTGAEPSARAQRQLDALETLLSRHITLHRQDPNNGYYLLMLASIAQQRGSSEQALARYLAASTLRPAPDYARFEKKNSALEALAASLAIERDPYRALASAGLLRARFPGGISEIELQYRSGKSYETLGEWDAAYAAYGRFLSASARGISVQNRLSDPYHDIRYDLTYRIARRNAARGGATSKTWASPEQAREAIRSAIYSGSAGALTLWRSPYFFTSHWREDELDTNASVPRFRIDVLARRSPVYMYPGFSSYSRQNVKFWETTGWERVSTWFFVFQKVHQPDIPKINGLWEWGGIYFGLGR